MSIINNQMLWRQFGAAIDTLGDAQLHLFIGQQAGKSSEWVVEAQ